MCVNVETALAVTRQCIEGDKEQFLLNKRAKSTIRQRQLGLLRNSRSADIISREIKAARKRALVEEKGGRSHFKNENRYPLERRTVSVLSREKLRMLQQIRSDNAMASSQRANQTDIRIASAPVTGYSQPRIHDQNNNLKSQACSNDSESNKEKGVGNQKDIMTELRERSKYLPVLMSEFKKLHLNFGLGVCEDPVVSDVKPSLNVSSYVPNDASTCATFLTAIKAARKKQCQRRASSAPKSSKPWTDHKIPVKPNSSIPTFRQFSKHTTTSSGNHVAPGVVAVYNHIPCPPPKDYKVHWNRRPCTDSVLTQTESRIGKNTSDSAKSQNRTRCKTVPAWRGRVRCIGTIRSESGKIDFSGTDEEHKKYLLCSQINLARSKVTQKHNTFPTISTSSAMLKLSDSTDRRRTVSTDGYDVNRPEDSETIGGALQSAKKKLRKRRMSVRFSDEKDKVFEYSLNDPIDSQNNACDEVANCKNTFELRTILDSAFGSL